MWSEDTRGVVGGRTRHFRPGCKGYDDAGIGTRRLRQTLTGPTHLRTTSPRRRLVLVCGLFVLVRQQDIRQAVSVLLEFLLAAGLLRLSDHQTYHTISTAAVIILVRKMLTFGLRKDQQSSVPLAG